MGDARKAALSALEKCRRAGAWSDAVLGSVMDDAGLDGRDRGLAAAICYGVMQNRSLLDAHIAVASSVKLVKIEPKVLDILRITAYQILFMDRVPAFAAVSEAVRLSKKLGFARAAGYINAVVRRIAEGKSNPAMPEDTAERLALQFSHPLWLTQYLIGLIGAVEAEDYLRCDNEPVPISLQVNTLRTDTEALMASLAAEGVSAQRHAYLPDCLVLSDVGALTKLKAFREGHFYVQDAAAKMAVMAAEPQPGARILDVCAAPGGKSFAAAIRSGEAAQITSCDLHENKLKRIRESAARLGLNNICAEARDARENRAEWNGAFDLVIADVPCSGLGVIRKKPDIRWKDPTDFDALPTIQKDILRNVARYVAPGGVLLYSTCTIRAEENGAVVTEFLSEHPEFRPEDFTAADGTVSENGSLQLWPQRNGTDGFYIAKLRRTK